MEDFTNKSKGANFNIQGTIPLTTNLEQWHLRLWQHQISPTGVRKHTIQSKMASTVQMYAAIQLSWATLGDPIPEMVIWEQWHLRLWQIYTILYIYIQTHLVLVHDASSQKYIHW